jgi:hypothetical protein
VGYLVMASLMTQAMLTFFSSTIFPSAALSSAARLGVIRSTLSPATGTEWQALREQSFMVKYFGSLDAVDNSKGSADGAFFENPKTWDPLHDTVRNSDREWAAIKSLSKRRLLISRI